MLLALFLSVFLVAHAVLAAPHNSTLLDKRQNGDQNSGWTSIPTPDTAILHKDWKISGHNLPLLVSNDTPSKIRRAVIILPAKHRNCWGYYTSIHNALGVASQQGLVSVEEVSVMAPCFMAPVDQAAGAVDASTLIWGALDWDYGADSVGPEGASISSYQVIDELVAYYMDPLRFPLLNTVVVAGHSMGGQMNQRYAALHKAGPLEGLLRSVHFWIANPGSMVWPVPERPNSVANCPTFDDWKYGLNGGFVPYANDAGLLGRQGLVNRYRSRNIHYLWGTADHGRGDATCQALAQGNSRIEIGHNFDAMLHAMPGGLPSTHTIDYVEGASHNDAQMMNSDAGLNKLFVVT